MRTRPLRAPLLLLVIWLAGAAVATSVGLLAVRLVAEQVGDPAVPPLSAQATAAAPAASAPTATPSAVPTGGAPTPSATPAAAPAVTSGTFRSAGGTVGVQCEGTLARLLYATPADGYALDERSAEGSELEVRFEAGESRVRLELSCASGRPVLVETRTDD